MSYCAFVLLSKTHISPYQRENKTLNHISGRLISLAYFFILNKFDLICV